MVLRLLVRLLEYNQRRIFLRFVYIDNSYLQLAPRAAHTSLLHYCFTITTLIKPVICERLAKFKIFKYTCIAIKNNNKNCYIFIRSPESLR